MPRGSALRRLPAMRLANHFITAVLLAAAVFHLLPAMGLLGAGRLAALYGVSIPGDDLLLLMRHRALLFGIRWSGVELLTYAMLPLLLGGVAVVVGIVALATAHRRGGGGFGAALTGLILGPLALVALFVGRYLGEEHLGFPYPG